MQGAHRHDGGGVGTRIPPRSRALSNSAVFLPRAMEPIAVPSFAVSPVLRQRCLLIPVPWLRRWWGGSGRHFCWCQTPKSRSSPHCTRLAPPLPLPATLLSRECAHSTRSPARTGNTAPPATRHWVAAALLPLHPGSPRLRRGRGGGSGTLLSDAPTVARRMVAALCIGL